VKLADILQRAGEYKRHILHGTPPDDGSPFSPLYQFVECLYSAHLWTAELSGLAWALHRAGEPTPPRVPTWANGPTAEQTRQWRKVREHEKQAERLGWKVTKGAYPQGFLESLPTHDQVLGWLAELEQWCGAALERDVSTYHASHGRPARLCNVGACVSAVGQERIHELLVNAGVRADWVAVEEQLENVREAARIIRAYGLPSRGLPASCYAAQKGEPGGEPPPLVAVVVDPDSTRAQRQSATELSFLMQDLADTTRPLRDGLNAAALADRIEYLADRVAGDATAARPSDSGKGEPAAPTDLITTRDIELLTGRTWKTISNDYQPPEPLHRHRGRKRAEYCYERIRPWLVERFPDRKCYFCESFDDVRRILASLLKNQRGGK
jgi:hypothetical protein